MASLPYETLQNVYFSTVDIAGAPYTGAILYSFQPDGQPLVWATPATDSTGKYFVAGGYTGPCIMHLYVQAQGPSPQLPVVDGGRMYFY